MTNFKLVSASLLLAPLFFPGTCFAPSGVHDIFPLRLGTTWIYRGTVSWYDMEAQKIVSARVTCKSEVVQQIQRDDFSAALLRGFPSDFDWSQGEAAPSDTLVVLMPDGHIYLSNDGRVDENFKKLETAPQSLVEMFGTDDFWMQLPLKKGMKFCDEESRKRPDDAYCWVVAATHPARLGSVKGIRRGAYRSFLVQYITNPDDTEFEFVPNVGFTSYRYHHHGSVADTELTLVEYRPPGETPPTVGARP
jgi:hypothetical protein